MDEDLPAAAARELAEETGLKGVPLEQLGAFGKPGRDPRGRAITIVYFGIAGKDSPQVAAADDAADVQWFDIKSLPSTAFDHDEIARCAIERLRQTQEYRNHVR
jgi:8-oxo-dGTP diphosphatase